MALWQSIILLGVVNAVFFAANTADAIYLWWHAQLPSGLGHSAFLHQGVYSLIAAVLLAAGLLAITFQQEELIARSYLLRALALGWVLQNLVLIAGVLRRLQLYVEAYQLSELRVYVGFFLFLISIGFVLLAWHIHRGMELGRLIGCNLLALLAFFFVIQFCDVGTWVGRWNVAQWKADPDRTLDIRYLDALGSRGWPALAEVAASDQPSFFKAEAESMLRAATEAEAGSRREHDWCAYQHRCHSRFCVLIRRFPELQ
jgi:hypothetical protein